MLTAAQQYSTNSRKFFCLFSRGSQPRNRNMQTASAVPTLHIGRLVCTVFFHKFKYLGHIINNELTDHDDRPTESACLSNPPVDQAPLLPAHASFYGAI
jgi:hypothetical protein